MSTPKRTSATSTSTSTSTTRSASKIRNATTTAGPIITGLYVRASTDEQSVDMQLDELRQVAARRGWNAVEYIDEGESGAKDSRPALDRLLEDARTGKLDLIAVWKIDRLGRGMIKLVEMIESFRAWGVNFYSLKDPNFDTTTATGKMLFRITAVLCEHERDQIRERVIAGIRRAQARGVHCGRKPEEIDVRPAVALLEQGRNLSEVSRILTVNRTTLRRRLSEVGEWPRMGVARTPDELGAPDRP